jgi:hypothetical protein
MWMAPIQRRSNVPRGEGQGGEARDRGEDDFGTDVASSDGGRRPVTALDVEKVPILGRHRLGTDAKVIGHTLVVSVVGEPDDRAEEELVAEDGRRDEEERAPPPSAPAGTRCFHPPVYPRNLASGKLRSMPSVTPIGA